MKQTESTILSRVVVNTDSIKAYKDTAQVVFPASTFSLKQFDSLKAILHELKREAKQLNLAFSFVLEGFKGDTHVVLKCKLCSNSMIVEQDIVNHRARILKCENYHDHRGETQDSERCALQSQREQLEAEIRNYWLEFQKYQDSKSLAISELPSILSNQSITCDVYALGINKSSNSFGRSCLSYSLFVDNDLIIQNYVVLGLKSRQQIQLESIAHALSFMAINRVYKLRIHCEEHISSDLNMMLRHGKGTATYQKQMGLIRKLVERFWGYKNGKEYLFKICFKKMDRSEIEINEKKIESYLDGWVKKKQQKI